MIMYNDIEYRYFMSDNKLMRFHIEQEEDFWENPRDEWDYIDKMYMSSREYTCTDDKIKEVRSNEDAIRMMIRDADIDVVSAVIEGKIPRMEIKYDDECEYYDLYVDDGIEASNDCYEWLEDDIIECLTIDDLEKMSDDLFVIALDFGYEGCINEAYNSDRFEPDGYIWMTADDMKKAGFKDMTADEMCKKAYEILNSDIEEENLWATGNVFWFEIEECTNVSAYERESNWIENDSCGGIIVDGYKADDEIFKSELGNIPYHNSLDDLYSWPEFKISFEDYFNVLAATETSSESDALRETLKDKIDWSVKSLEDYKDEVIAAMTDLKSRLSDIIDTINNELNKPEYDTDLYKYFNGASADYQKTYTDYTDLNYKLNALKEIA